MFINVISEWSCSLADICTCSFFPAFHLLWSLWAAPVRFPRTVELFDAPGPWDVLAVLSAEPPHPLLRSSASLPGMQLLHVPVG